MLGGGVGILIMMQQVRLMLFLLKMVDFSVSPSPLWVNFGFKLGWTGLGLGLLGSGQGLRGLWCLTIEYDESQTKCMDYSQICLNCACQIVFQV